MVVTQIATLAKKRALAGSGRVDRVNIKDMLDRVDAIVIAYPRTSVEHHIIFSHIQQLVVV